MTWLELNLRDGTPVLTNMTMVIRATRTRENGAALTFVQGGTMDVTQTIDDLKRKLGEKPKREITEADKAELLARYEAGEKD